jgi:hypothetical protein
MTLYGKGMLITFSETPHDAEENFNEWYNREHIDERVWMPASIEPADMLTLIIMLK